MDQITTWFGEIEYAQNLETVRRFWQGNGRFLISLFPTQNDYRQKYDLSEMLLNTPSHLENMARLPGINLPSIWYDWGTVSNASHWGGEIQFDSLGKNIFIQPAAQTVDQALALTPRPVDDPDMDAHHALQFYKTILQQLKTSHLWMRTADMQGPLNTAGQIVNQEEFYVAMMNEPAKVHALLEKVTQFLIDLFHYYQSETNGQLCGSIWPYTFYPIDLGISFTEDLMPLLSKKMYREFGIPCLKQLEEAFGALHIHCCGSYGHHVDTLAKANLNISALEFFYPMTTLEMLAPLADHVVLVPNILLVKQDRFTSVTEYYRHLIKTSPANYRFWFACSEDGPEFQAFAKEYGF